MKSLTSYLTESYTDLDGNFVKELKKNKVKVVQDDDEACFLVFKNWQLMVFPQKDGFTVYNAELPEANAKNPELLAPIFNSNDGDEELVNLIDLTYREVKGDCMFDYSAENAKAIADILKEK